MEEYIALENYYSNKNFGYNYYRVCSDFDFV